MFNTEVYRQDVERAAARVEHLTKMVHGTADEEHQVARFTMVEADKLYADLLGASQALAYHLEELARARTEFELKMGREGWSYGVGGGRVKEEVPTVA